MEQNPIKAIVVVVVMVLIPLLYGCAQGAVNARLSGWKKVATAFPVEGPQKADNREDYKKVSGIAGQVRYRFGFLIKISPAGLMVKSYLPFHEAIFIPWTKINEVRVAENTCVLAVDYVQPLEFRLPGTALGLVKELAPALSSRISPPVNVINGRLP
jgi:hypothetical protein